MYVEYFFTNSIAIEFPSLRFIKFQTLTIAIKS